MSTEISTQLHQLPRLGKLELLALWRELFTKPAHPRLRRNLMIPILAYRIPEQAHGGLKPATRRRLQKLAAELEQNQKAPLPLAPRLRSGTKLLRQWQGEMHEVLVGDEGFEYRGKRHESLSEIASQRHEGWHVVAKKYDDGGFSGGNMNRPGLKQLLDDIAARLVDTVVVYKVDRLTRSLTDFAKIIEAFDQQGVSFVSVTQQFNTTSSMGRLTLNVLLSFAQFEREVTGERIRDKIAASKKKGLWMGGVAPLGYDVKDRQLIVNPQEGNLVREIFTQYLSLGSVAALKQYLDRKSLRTKVRTSANGHVFGGKPYSRGGLYKLLNNQVYTGRIAHRGESYRGEHQAILEPETWEKVRALLAANNQGHAL